MAGGLQKFLRQTGRNPEDLTLLDFACGYGRITRFLASMFKEVRCSDLDQSMLDFNRENFEVEGFLSALSPDGVAWPEDQFDVVFSFSLFTHLPETTWDDWFWCLFDRVKPNGLFVVTTRPATLARRSEGFGENDTFAFTPRNETRGRIDVDCYGSTTVSTAYVDSVIYKRPGTIERIALYPGGTMDLHQDTHIFRRKKAG
jgi:SAM-dependent methyltransferase